MRTNFILLFFLCSILFFNEQLFSNDKEIIVDKLDANFLSLTEYFSVLEDPSLNLKIEDVIKPDVARRFIASLPQTALSYGLTKSAYWLRFRVRNNTTSSLDQIFEISYALLSDIQFYEPIAKENFKLRRSGTGMNFEKRPYLNRFFVFPLNIPPNSDKIFYIRLESTSAILIPAKLWQLKAYHTYERDDYLGQALYFGIAISMILFNLLLFLALRESIYLAYVSFVILIALTLASRNGLGQEFLWPRSPAWSQISFYFFGSMANAALLIFMRRMLETKKIIPKFDTFLKTIIFLFFIIPIFFVILPNVILKFFVILTLTISLLIFGTGIYMATKRQRSAVTFVAAFSLLLLGVFLTALRGLGLLPTNMLTTNALQFGSALEMILLAFALADRFNVIRKEKENAQKDALNAQAESLINQNLAIESLEKSNRLKDEFLANTSHELRTPLNGIIGIAESLSDGVAGNLSTKAKENLSLIITSGKRLSNLINDILDFSKLKHKELQINLLAVDLYSLTNIIIKLSEPLLKNKKLIIVNDLSENIPAVLADENRLQQILYNLIGNAIKFTDAGEIRISAKVDTDFLKIMISDTGIGIPEDQLESIFESFEQVDSSISRKYGGTGLGLSVTKQLINLHGGKIKAESKLGFGSNFIFTLPITYEKPISIHQENRTAIVSSLDENKIEIVSSEVLETKAHILVVDDEPINIQVISNHFTLRGYKVTTANSGKEAMDFFEKFGKPDIVLLDVMMPQMTGFEVCQRIRERYDINQLPVLFLSAKNMVDDLLKGFMSEGNDYIVKPFSKEELLSRVGIHIKLKDKTQQLVDYSLNLEQKVIDRTKELTNTLNIIRGDLSVAKKIQEKTLVIHPSLQENLKILQTYIPMTEVGGDYYDVSKVNDSTYRIFLADATGHGVQAAMITMAIKGIYDNIKKYDLEADRIMEIFNAEFVDKYASLNSLLTAIIIDIDITHYILKYASAGHPAAILQRKAIIQSLEKTGRIIGVKKDSRYKSKEFLFGPGDRLYVFTDGLFEEFNRNQEEFGEENLHSIFANHSDLSIEKNVENVLDRLSLFLDGEKNQDDITLLGIEYHN